MKSSLSNGEDREDRIIGVTPRAIDDDQGELDDDPSWANSRLRAAYRASLGSEVLPPQKYARLMEALKHIPQVDPDAPIDDDGDERVIRAALNFQPSVTMLDRSSIAARIDSGRVVAVPEFADDQAAPRQALDDFFRHRTARDDPRAQAVLTPWVQREFRRALINSELLVINERFLAHSSSLVQLYRQDAANREGMVALLAQQAIAPFVREGDDSDAFPASPRVPHEGAEAWLAVVKSARASGGMTRVRLDHDDALNAKLHDELVVRRFQALCSSLNRRNLVKLRDDLGLQPELAGNLRPLLELLTVGQNLATDLALRRASDEGEPGHISRTDLYRAFVSSRPEIGLYDGGALLEDPHLALANTDWDDWAPRFAQIQQRHDRDVLRACGRGLKELIDLLYNTCIPDALGAYSLTPAGALPRTALQELSAATLWTETNGQERIRAKDVLDMVRSKAFSTAMEQFCAPEIANLSLTQIVEVRQTDTWKAYMASLGNLLRTPGAFAEEGPAVYANYMELVSSIVPRPTTCVHKLAPSPRLKIQIDGAMLDIMWDGDQVFWDQHTGVEHIRSIDRAPLSLQFGIGDRRGDIEAASWTTMTEFYRGPIPDPVGALQTIVQGLEGMRQSRFQTLNRVTQPSTLDLPSS